MKKSIKTRLEENRVINPETGCWEWSLAKNKQGRGVIVFYVDGGPKNFLVPRIAYEFYIGPIPPGFEVCHSCDNPSCFNPRHLFSGPHEDNMKDMKQKGRGKGGKGMLGVYGERHHSSKLTDKQVIDIYYSKGTHVSIAHQYGVSQSTITNIKNKKRGVTRLLGDDYAN